MKIKQSTIIKQFFIDCITGKIADRKFPDIGDDVISIVSQPQYEEKLDIKFIKHDDSELGKVTISLESPDIKTEEVSYSLTSPTSEDIFDEEFLSERTFETIDDIPREITQGIVKLLDDGSQKISLIVPKGFSDLSNDDKLSLILEEFKLASKVDLDSEDELEGGAGSFDKSLKLSEDGKSAFMLSNVFSGDLPINQGIRRHILESRHIGKLQLEEERPSGIWVKRADGKVVKIDTQSETLQNVLDMTDLLISPPLDMISNVANREDTDEEKRLELEELRHVSERELYKVIFHTDENDIDGTEDLIVSLVVEDGAEILAWEDFELSDIENLYDTSDARVVGRNLNEFNNIMVAFFPISIKLDSEVGGIREITLPNHLPSWSHGLPLVTSAAANLMVKVPEGVWKVNPNKNIDIDNNYGSTTSLKLGNNVNLSEFKVDLDISDVTFIKGFMEDTRILGEHGTRLLENLDISNAEKIESFLSVTSDNIMHMTWSDDLYLGAEIIEPEPLEANLNGWDISNLDNMDGMFLKSRGSFDISQWDVDHVLSARSMFGSAKKFNQDLSNLHFKKITGLPYGVFDETDAWTKPKPRFGRDDGSTGPLQEDFGYTRYFNRAVVDLEDAINTALTTMPLGVARALGSPSSKLSPEERQKYAEIHDKLDDLIGRVHMEEFEIDEADGGGLGVMLYLFAVGRTPITHWDGFDFDSIEGVERFNLSEGYTKIEDYDIVHLTIVTIPYTNYYGDGEIISLTLPNYIPGWLKHLPTIYAQSPVKLIVDEGTWSFTRDENDIDQSISGFGKVDLSEFKADLELNGVTNLTSLFGQVYKFGEHGKRLVETLNVDDVSVAMTMFSLESKSALFYLWDDSGNSTINTLHFESELLDLSKWNTGNFKVTSSMFNNSVDNFILDGWDMGNVTDAGRMFRNANNFNQDLSDLRFSKITEQPSEFDSGASSWTLPRPKWGSE